MGMTNRKYAIVTDGLWRKSLSAIRSLGKQGYAVTVLGSSNVTIGFWSRYTHRRVVCPSAASDPKTFGKALLEELAHPRYTSRPVLFPMEDPTMIWLSEHRKEVSTYADFLIPPIESLEIAEDKGKTIVVARELSIPQPLTHTPTSVDEAWKLIQKAVTLPYVLKPVFGTGSAGIRYVTSTDQVTQKELSNMWRTNGQYIIQERIPTEGTAIGVNMIYDAQSRCVGHFVHKRLQQYPISGGPSTDRISIQDAELVKLSQKLLNKLSWQGVAMLEWKEDPASGVKKLLEINPRFWGSLELATRSGIDFSILYADLAQGKTVSPEKTTYTKNTRCRWLIPGDILRYFSTPSAQRESLSQFLKGLPHNAEEWDATDIRGCISVIVCTGLLALHPRYWKYVRR